MKSDNSKIKEIFSGLVFTDDEIRLIESVFHKVNAKKGTILIKEGDIVDTQYYILEGCLRSYHVDIYGKEYTVQFGIKDWWISDYTAFFSEKKAIMTVEVLQDSILYKISKTDRDYLYEHIPRVDSYIRKKLEKAFSSFQERILSYLSQSASERYLNFVKSNPNIESQIKNYHIASYLGITTESLSRIRKDLMSNN